MEITNKTKKPIRVPLPGGKKLFLGPGKTGQVTQKAMEHPPIVQLLAAGDLEAGDKGFERKKATRGTAKASGERHGGSGAMRQSGDR